MNCIPAESCADEDEVGGGDEAVETIEPAMAGRDRDRDPGLAEHRVEQAVGQGKRCRAGASARPDYEGRGEDDDDGGGGPDLTNAGALGIWGKGW